MIQGDSGTGIQDQAGNDLDGINSGISGEDATLHLGHSYTTPTLTLATSGTWNASMPLVFAPSIAAISGDAGSIVSLKTTTIGSTSSTVINFTANTINQQTLSALNNFVGSPVLIEDMAAGYTALDGFWDIEAVADTGSSASITVPVNSVSLGDSSWVSGSSGAMHISPSAGANTDNTVPYSTEQILVSALEQITGAITIPITGTAVSSGIFVGETPQFDGGSGDLVGYNKKFDNETALGPTGYIVNSNGSNLYLVGGPNGTGSGEQDAIDAFLQSVGMQEYGPSNTVSSDPNIWQITPNDNNYKGLAGSWDTRQVQNISYLQYTDNDGAANSERQGWDTFYLFNFGGGSPTPATGAGTGSLATQAADVGIGVTTTNLDSHPDWWASGTNISLSGTSYAATFMPLGTISVGDTFSITLKQGTTPETVTITANATDNSPSGIANALYSFILADNTDTFFESTSIVVKTNSDYNTNGYLTLSSTTNPVVEIYDKTSSIPVYKASSSATSSSGATLTTDVYHDSQLNYADPGVYNKVLTAFVSPWVNTASSGSLLSLSSKDGPGYDQSQSTLTDMHSNNPFQTADVEFDWQGYNQNGVLVDAVAESYWTLVNELDQYVLQNEGSRTLYVAGLGYASTSQPPSFAMEPNVVIESSQIFEDTPYTTDQQMKIETNHGALAGLYLNWSIYLETGYGNPVPPDYLPANVESNFALYNDDHVFDLEGEGTAAYGGEMPGYLMVGQISNNPSVANATTMQNMLTNYYNSIYGPAATNMEDYSVLFNGTGADPNLSSPPTQMTFNGMAFGAFGEPVGTYTLPTATPSFNIVVREDLALQQAFTYVNNADSTLSTALGNGSITSAQYNTYQARVDQIRMYDHFMFLEYQLESDYFGLGANVSNPAINSANFNTILTDLTNLTSWVNDLVTTDLVDTTNFDNTSNFETFAFKTLKYYWNAGTAADTTLLNLLSVKGTKAEPTQTVLNGDWTTDEASLAISAAPTNLAAAIVSSTENDLTWTDNAASPDNQTGLNIYRSTDDVTFSFLVSKGAAATSYHDTSVTSGTSYWYEIQSFNTSGDSIFNGPVKAVSGLAAPSGLTAAAASSSQINLTWTDNDGGTATAYDVDRSTTSTGGFSQIGTAGSGATSYSDTGLTASTTYYYEVDAVDAATTSAFSNIAHATTSGGSLGAPSGLAATEVNDANRAQEIDLSWTDNDGGLATAYDVDRSTTSTGGFAQIGTAGSGATAYTDSSVFPSTTYYYEVDAVDSSSTSAFSNIANATTPTNEVGAVVTDNWYGTNGSAWSGQWTQTNNLTNATASVTINSSNQGQLKFTSSGGTMGGKYLTNINTQSYQDSYQNVLVTASTTGMEFELVARTATNTDTVCYYAELIWAATRATTCSSTPPTAAAPRSHPSTPEPSAPPTPTTWSSRWSP